jgi:hypothetical protein
LNLSEIPLPTSPIPACSLNQGVPPPPPPLPEQSADNTISQEEPKAARNTQLIKDEILKLTRSELSEIMLRDLLRKLNEQFSFKLIDEWEKQVHTPVPPSSLPLKSVAPPLVDTVTRRAPITPPSPTPTPFPVDPSSHTSPTSTTYQPAKNSSYYIEDSKLASSQNRLELSIF